jgi:ATP-dependent protease ClpP protease subunit
MDYNFEQDCDRAKADWRNRHRWRSPEPEIWVSLIGDIDREAVDRIVADIDSAPDAPVVCTMNSAGGDAWQALRCYQLLRAHPAPVTTIVDGLCSSAAILPQLAGDRRLASTNAAVFFLHFAEFASPIESRPSAANLRDNAELLEAMDSEFIAITELRCPHWPRYKIQTAFEGERRYDAHDAQLHGIIHEVSGDE